MSEELVADPVFANAVTALLYNKFSSLEIFNFCYVLAGKCYNCAEIPTFPIHLMIPGQGESTKNILSTNEHDSSS